MIVEGQNSQSIGPYSGYGWVIHGCFFKAESLFLGNERTEYVLSTKYLDAQRSRPTSSQSRQSACRDAGSACRDAHGVPWASRSSPRTTSTASTGTSSTGSTSSSSSASSTSSTSSTSSASST